MIKIKNNRHHYFELKIILQIIMFIGMAIAVYQNNWLNTFLTVCIIFLTLFPTILRQRYFVFIPHEFELLAIVFIFCAEFLGALHGFYDKFWWWDKILHTSSGFLLGIVGFLLIYILNKQEKIQFFMKPGFIALFSFTFAVAIAALWEIYEFTMDQLFDMKMQYNVLYSNLQDTMWDLIVDTFGALFISLIGYFYMKSGKESFIHEWITKFIKANPIIFKKKYKVYNKKMKDKSVKNKEENVIW